MDGICHLGVRQLGIVYQLHFSVRDQGFGSTKTFDKEKACVWLINSIPKSSLQEWMGVADFSGTESKKCTTKTLKFRMM